MDVDAEAINSGQGRYCHKIINDKKEQKMNNGNNDCGGRGSPVNVMDFDGEEKISSEIADKIMPMLIKELFISGLPADSHKSYGGKVLDILMSKLNLSDTSGSNKRQRIESRSGGGDIIGTSFDFAEKSRDGVGLGGDADSFGTGDYDMSTDHINDMAVDESDSENNMVLNNVLQEKLDGISEDELDSSLATTGKLCIIHTYV
jgi:hypothetical protein